MSAVFSLQAHEVSFFCRLSGRDFRCATVRRRRNGARCAGGDALPGHPRARDRRAQGVGEGWVYTMVLRQLVKRMYRDRDYQAKRVQQGRHTAYDNALDRD